MNIVKIPVKIKEQQFFKQEKNSAEEKLNKTEQKRHSARTITMFVCNIIIYSVVYVTAILFFLGFLQTETNNWQTVLIKIIFVIVFLAIAVLMFLSIIESFKDDKKDVQNHFNTNVSFIAIIIAIIALLKGAA